MVYYRFDFMMQYFLLNVGFKKSVRWMFPYELCLLNRHSWIYILHSIYILDIIFMKFTFATTVMKVQSPCKNNCQQKNDGVISLNHRGRVTHTCVSKLIYHWLSKMRVAFCLFGAKPLHKLKLFHLRSLWAYFSEIFIEMQQFSYVKWTWKCHLKLAAILCRPQNVCRRWIR